VGKTVLAKSLARSIACKFSRIQLTPICCHRMCWGVSIFNSQTQQFDFKPGRCLRISFWRMRSTGRRRGRNRPTEAMSEEQVSVETKRSRSSGRLWWSRRRIH